MNEYSEIYVPVKIKSYELQEICRLLDKLHKTDSENKDTAELELDEKILLESLLNRIKASAAKKASRFESLGQEFRNSIEFAD